MFKKDSFGNSGRTKISCDCTVSKTDDAMIACGEVDGLVSSLGMVKAVVADMCCCRMKTEIEYLQRLLFRVGTEIASFPYPDLAHDSISDVDIDVLMGKIDEIQYSIDMPKDFVLPGSNMLSASLDMARVHCRSLERAVVRLIETDKIKNKRLIVLLNKMSSYLYLLARQTENNEYNLVKE